jgi:CheY-like chemotaxis protein
VLLIGSSVVLLTLKRFLGVRQVIARGRPVFLSFYTSGLLNRRDPLSSIQAIPSEPRRLASRLGSIRVMEQVALHFRILVADDHSSFRHMLRTFLELNRNLTVCGEASDGWEAVVRTTELKPDIVILDLDMPKMKGSEAARRIRETSPGTRILILTLHEFSTLQQIAQDFGAQGLVFKSQPFEVLTDAIETLGHTNKSFISPHRR